MTLEVLFERLPPQVAERVRTVSERPLRGGGTHVLYWMHHAVRGHENPALDAAMVAAGELDLPLLVYQGLGGKHRHDSDRHHTFILEGARDVREELAGRGIAHVFWLGDVEETPSPLLSLAERAALVVTEDFPVPPFPAWTERLAARSEAAIWAIDTACVVPMQLVSRFHDRAFRFRDAIRKPLAERLERPWAEVGIEPRSFDRSLVPFSDVDFDGERISDLVARCAVDHTVGPVAHSPGGSAAGYRRWSAFRDKKLRSYAARRNDAAGAGVSRMSPYLHYGQVSPLRIARQAARIGGKGAEKFLDELIVWRELAHNLCFHRHQEIESLAVLPGWARDTLAEHRDDKRRILSNEALARGRTGDRLWDLCQASLVRHGELHNNVRMTWGKAIPGWTESSVHALETLLDLNNRFALDGSDPNSYGGLLWCLGLFDRPFSPPTEVLGSVRSRPTTAHSPRLDVESYSKRVLRPATERPLKVAVVGAGLSGLACARVVADHGHRVRVFEKSRGAGGRMSTRRGEVGWFDHGAQYFTVRDRRFRRWVDAWRQDGLVEQWTGRIVVLDRTGMRPTRGTTERLVPVPGMSALCRHLSTDVDVVYDSRVIRLERCDGRWHLEVDGEGGDVFDAVVVSAPAPQTGDLLAEVAPQLAAKAREVEMSPCWSVMAAFPEALDLPFDGAFVADSALSWVARDASKPGREGDDSWVLHGSPQWSEAHLELETEEASTRLLEAFSNAIRGLEVAPSSLSAHRWRFALPTSPLAEVSLFDRDLRLAACGDWCDGPRVEGAFLSGCAAAGRVLALSPVGTQRGLFGES